MVDAQHLPLRESGTRNATTPDLAGCNRLTITYEPSALEYSFPSESQRFLFDPTEMETLRIAHDVVVDDANDLKEFIAQINAGYHRGITLRRASARVVCNHDADCLATIEMYGDSFVTEAGDRFPGRGPSTMDMPRGFEGSHPGCRPL